MSSVPFGVNILFTLLRAALPPWGDDLVDIAEEVADDWERLVRAARQGWTDGDEDSVAGIVVGTVENAPHPPGYREDDARVLGAAAAVITRWIAHAPKRIRRVQRRLGKGKPPTV